MHSPCKFKLLLDVSSDILKTNKMKKLVIILNTVIVLFSSCVTQKMGTSTYNDDVYSNPKEDRIESARIAEINRKEQEAIDKRYNDSIAAIKLAQKQKDDANPYYKDREFKYDDYYDYEYATRVKRFNNNINGLGYYDNYYTNSYWYNKNPYNYGVSVYNGYSWWGSSYNSYSYNPSANFYNNNGWGCNSGFGYNGYNPYMGNNMQGYNNGFNSGFLSYNYGYGNQYGYGNPYGYGNSFGYGSSFGFGNYGYGNPYSYGGYGYNNGFNNPYNGWGYYNSKDNNSSYTYGPRSSHGGGNSHRTSDPGMTGKRDTYVEKYIDAVKDQQIRTVKFSEPENPRINNSIDPIRVNSFGVPIETGGIKNPSINHNIENTPIRGNTIPIKNTDANEPTRNAPIRNNDNIAPVKEPLFTNPIRVPIQNEPPIRQNPIKTDVPIRQNIEPTPRFETPVRQNNNFQTPNMPSNNGGGNSPSNNGGGHRPR